ncbi:hypothetical protein AAU57_03300 [Nonlabens sp. YIK11]|uniref:T9SS type A sorting domain-containing protein n=1 Tax=Nonlabens sp. YIK11 TaxID=1453349 RepID=UPI0006DCF9A0|nr:T9SS type A sorting domain-containing protein [Nonlabens sp. YIK11]KQC32466.1 hypothetical protein AAU57_03300 [Nonlabens sp. YIK11]
MKYFFTVIFFLISYLIFAQNEWEQLYPDIFPGKIILVDHLNESQSIVVTANEFYKSFDSGETWVMMKRFTGSNFSSASIVDNTIVLFGGSRIFISGDDGSTWESKNTGNSSFDAKFNMVNKNLFYVTNGYSYFVTKNGGDSWTEKEVGSDTYISQLYFVNDKLGFALLREGSILKSEDGGVTWENVLNVPETSVSNTAIKFYNPNFGILSTNGKVFNTNNGGQSWDLMQNANHNFSDIYFLSENEFFLINPDIHYSQDGGRTFISEISLYNNVNSIDYQKGSGFIAGGDKKSLAISSNGVDWELKFIGSPNFKNLVMFDNYTGYHINNGKLYKSIDGGFAWVRMTEANPNFNQTNAIHEASFISVEVGYARKGDHEIIKTIDGGLTWSRYFFESNGSITYLKAIGNDNIIISGKNTQREKYSKIIFNDGQDFEIVSDNIFIKIEWLTDQLGFAIEADEQVLYRTIDSGKSWQKISNTIMTNIKSFDFVDDLIGYAGTNDGDLWKTINGGNQWELINQFQNEIINDIEFLDDKMGFFTSNKTRYTLDGGLNFASLTTGSKTLQIVGDYLYGTADRILRLDLNEIHFELITDQTTDQSSTQASIKAYASGPLINPNELSLEYSANGVTYIPVDSLEQSITPITNGEFKVESNLKQLNPSTTYYYRLKCNINGKFYYSKIKSFKTEKDVEIELISVETFYDYIGLNYSITSSDYSVEDLRLIYSSNSEGNDGSIIPTINSISAEQTTSQITFVNNLIPNTNYYLRLAGYINGNYFESDYYTVRTLSAIDFQITSIEEDPNFITINGTVKPWFRDASNITLEYGDNFFNNTTVGNINNVESGLISNIKFNIPRLDNDVLYKFRLRATLDGKLFYSEISKIILGQDRWLINGKNDFSLLSSPVLEMLGYSKNDKFNSIGINYGEDTTMKNNIEFDISNQPTNGFLNKKFHLYNIKQDHQYYYQFYAIDAARRTQIQSAMYTFTQQSALSEESLNRNDLMVYPNPFDSEIIIKFPSENVKSFLLYDMTGRLLFFKTVDSRTENIDTSLLSAGSYLLLLRGEKGTSVHYQLKKI